MRVRMNLQQRGARCLLKPAVECTEVATGPHAVCGASKCMSVPHRPCPVRMNDYTAGVRGGAGEVVIPEGMQRWHNDVAVVTGAASGVGWAVCSALLDAGMRVVGAAGRKDRLQALQAHALRRGVAGDMFLPVLCDVTREEEVRALVSIAVKTFSGKPVRVLVAAAAERPADGGQVIDGDAKAWVDMLSTNLLAAGTCCREVCGSMRLAGEWGHIVIVGGPTGVAPPLPPSLCVHRTLPAVLHLNSL